METLKNARLENIDEILKLHRSILERFGLDLEESKKIEEVDTFRTLTETPPTTTIGQAAWRVEYANRAGKRKALQIGTLFNPGHLPRISTVGLAISQIAGAVHLHRNPVSGRKKRTPMVTWIDHIALTDQADIKTPQANFFLIVIPENSKNSLHIKNAQVFYSNQNLCRSTMTMQNLPPNVLKRKGERNRLDWSKMETEKKENIREKIFLEEAEKYPGRKNLGELFLAGFGDTFKVQKRFQVSPTIQIGLLQIDEGVFEGHFPGANIIPLAGSAIPGFAMALDWYRQENTEKFFDISSLRGVRVHEPLLPNDIAVYEVEKMGKNTFSINVSYFDRQKRKKKNVITFESVTIGLASRQKGIWKDIAVADAFEFQNRILEYETGQLAVFQKMIRKALLDILKLEAQSINITDIGTGSTGNIARTILGTIRQIALTDREKTFESINLTISDVEPHIVEKARKKLQKFVGQVDFFGQKIAINKIDSGKEGEVVPRMKEKQNIIGANFSLNYGDIDRAIFRLSRIVHSQGQVVLGLVNSHPKYSQLFNIVASRMNRKKNWQYYDKYLIMKEVGNAMDFFDIMGIEKNCKYISADEAVKKLRQNGFRIEDIKKDTFCGIGFIVRAKK